MERLETAMAKARAARMKATSVLGEKKSPSQKLPPNLSPRAAAASTPVQDAMPDANWESLKPIQISTRTAARNRLASLLGAQAAGPYDMLRSRVLRQMKEAGWTRLAITSPNAGCGKSTVSLNLALSMARQPDLRILLVDMDLRRPSLTKHLNHPGRESLAALLDGRVDFADHALRYGKNLAICLNHAPVRNSSELLQSRKTAQVLNEIQEQWKPDIIVFDTPPMQGNDDNLGFLDQVDCALLIAEAEATTIAQLDVCEKELSGLTNVIGTVLNKCRYADSEAGYDTGYY